MMFTRKQPSPPFELGGEKTIFAVSIGRLTATKKKVREEDDER
jgi:hypothetical protein